MVVVAIMGTLAAIAIPAYNEYRKSAKKTAYKSDMLSLHKGWLAFGVELDSFCERETIPKIASVKNVGMISLFTSNLYGGNTTAASCDSTTYGAGCGGCTVSGDTCTGTTASCTSSADDGQTCGIVAFVPADSPGPGGKQNFIGFGEDNCGVPALTSRQIKLSTVTDDTDCDLNISAYRMGVGGHISGNTYYGVSINHNGVLGKESEANTTTIFAIGGVCS